MASSILITGSNRGIGKELLKLYLARPHTTVISGVRDVNHPSVGELQALPVGTDSRLIIVKLDSGSPTGATDAVEELQLKFGVSQLDTVIANAGIGKYWGPATQTPIHEVEEHFKINAVAPVHLFQAVQPLLFAASTPRFVVISTVLGSIALQKDFPVPDAAYGMSKIAVNFFVGKLHHENTQLITFPIHPGWVKTALGNGIAAAIGMKEAPVTVEESAAGVFEQIENSTREETSGNFIGFDGSNLPW